MIYSVKSGDSLSKIARDVLGNMALWPEIARLNNISAPYIINPGQQLKLPDTQATAAAPSAATSPAPLVQQPSVAARLPAMRPAAGPGAALIGFLQQNYLWVAGGIGAVLVLSLIAPGKKVGNRIIKRKRLLKRGRKRK